MKKLNFKKYKTIQLQKYKKKIIKKIINKNI